MVEVNDTIKKNIGTTTANGWSISHQASAASVTPESNISEVE